MNWFKARWCKLLCIAALSIAACSSAKPGTPNDGNPISTGGAPSLGSGGNALPAAGAGGQGSGGKSALPGAGTGGAAGKGTGGTGVSGAGGASAATGGTSGGGSGGAQAPGVACKPADKKPDPMAVPFTWIPGYQSMSKEPTTGPDKPVMEADPGLPEWTVYRSEILGGGETKHPVLAWGNGGCLQNGTLYGQWLLELASHGFVVLADGTPQTADADPSAGGIRGGGDGEPLVTAIEWLLAENERPCSQYYRKIDATKVAVAGQSCGGLMSLSAAGDERVATAIVFNSGLFAPNQAIYSALHTPIAYFIGGESDMAYANAESDVENINNVPLFYGNLAVGHGGTFMQTNAGEFGRVGLGWLQWQLNGDATAEKMFVGADCELCKSPSEWVVEKKMID